MSRLTWRLASVAVLVASVTGCRLHYAKTEADRARVELLKTEDVFQLVPAGAEPGGPITTSWGGEPPELVEMHEINRLLPITAGNQEDIALEYLAVAESTGWSELKVRCSDFAISVSGLKLVDGDRATFQASVDGEDFVGDYRNVTVTAFVLIVDDDAPRDPDPDRTLPADLDCLASAR
jgi:hypothetical protein